MPEIEIGDSIADMLEKRNFQTEGRRIMLVRHTLNNQPPSLIDFVKRAPENFAEWQCIQNKSKKNRGYRLLGCDYVVAFCGLQNDNGNSRFAGVFRNHSGNPAETLDINRHLSLELARIYRDDKDPEPAGRYFFQFCKEPRFAEWEGRIVFDWANQPPNNWVRELTHEFNPIVQQVIARESTAPFADWQ